VSDLAWLCTHCRSINHASAVRCYSCGHTPGQVRCRRWAGQEPAYQDNAGNVALEGLLPSATPDPADQQAAELVRKRGPTRVAARNTAF
jgi:hypothetical protein